MVPPAALLTLYALPEEQAHAAAAVGLDDIERRQHVRQLTHAVLAGCSQASQAFTWIRAAGLRSVSAALLAGLADAQALAAVLEATYSQVLEVILSTLDRDLLPPQPQLPDETLLQAHATGAAAAFGGGAQQAQALLACVGRCPAGYAPAAASSEELVEAYSLLQALCLLHAKSRLAMSSAQYLQLTTARACEEPACLPAATHVLVALMAGNEEAQALFVTTGGLDMLLTRTLQHTQPPQQQQAGAAGGKAGADGSSSSSGNALLRQLLVFLQLLAAIISDAVKKGAHPSTQRAALALVARHLGPRVSQGLTAALPSHVLAAAQQPAHAAAGVGGGVSSVWGLSEQLAAAVEAKADELLEAALAQRHQQPQSAAR